MMFTEVEPHLQPLTGEVLVYTMVTAVLEDDA